MAEQPDGGKPPPLPQATEDAPSEGKWWHMVLIGLGLIAGSGFIWWYLDSIERGEGPRRINAILALLYNIGGKALCVGVVGGVGGLFLLFGIIAFFQRTKASGVGEEADEEDDR